MTTLTEEIIAFRDARDWEQFHTHRNLAEAISVEAGELLEVFLWDRLPQAKRWERACEETADVLIFALTLCHELGVSPESLVRGKLTRNAERYPVATSKGTALRPEEKGA